MANGHRIGSRNVPGVDGTSGVWTLREIADAARKGVWPGYVDRLRILGASAIYTMEESSGTQMSDVSPNANHGAYINGALPSTPPLFKEGEQSLNPVSNLYATAPGAVASATSGFSIVFWAQWTHTSNLIVCERNQNNGYSIQTQASGKIGCTSWNGGAFSYLLSSGAANSGTPRCVVFVFGATAAASYLYVDGADVTTRPGGDATPSYGATTVWDIGSRAGTLALDGRLDGVAFVPSLLTAADALALYTAGKI